jgi:DNA polymerase III epsilon subunit-like protein
MNRIYAGVDVETTGLVAGVHEIIQIGIAVFDPKTYELTGGTFKSDIKPLKKFAIDPKAVEMNGFVYSDALPEPHQVRSALINWKEEMFGDSLILPLGHNYDGFDKNFLKLWLGDWYDKIFDYHSKDSWKLIETLVEIGLLPSNMKLRLPSIAEYFGIRGQFHDALEDATLSVKVYKTAINLLKDSLVINPIVN